MRDYRDLELTVLVAKQRHAATTSRPAAAGVRSALCLSQPLGMIIVCFCQAQACSVRGAEPSMSGAGVARLAHVG